MIHMLRRRQVLVLSCSRALVLFVLVGACASQRERRPRATDRNQPVARPLDVYRRLGFMAGPAEFPAVARITTLAGPADSTYVLLSFSMPNSALRFQRDAAGFYAEYRVQASLLRDSVEANKLDKREIVHVSNFQETSREDESIIFQDVVAVLPGTYMLRLHANDLNSSRGLQAIDTINVPAYGHEAKLSEPILVFQAAGRFNVTQRPDLIVNPRSTVAYGGDAPRVYLESYGATRPTPVRVRVVDDGGAALWAGEAKMEEGTTELRFSIVDVPAGALPIGRVWIETFEAADSTKKQRMPLLVTISDQWMVANFDEMLEFVRYIAYPSELDSLRSSRGVERNQLWDRFWTRRDPYPAIPGNEFRDQFFQRVRTAVEEFPEPGVPGWKSERGEVYIVLGPPAYINERYVGGRTTARPNVVEWLYQDVPGGPIVLQFLDRTGFGRFELSQGSQATFISAAHRLRPK
jgi:GWxTD domain-containing protein